MDTLDFNDGLLSSENIDKMFEGDDYIPLDKQDETSSQEEDGPKGDKEEKDNTGEDYIPLEASGSESVASGEDTTKDNTVANQSNASPNNIFSIAKALVDDGVFTDVSEEELNNVQTASDFVKLINKQVENKLDSAQKRINDALNNGVEPTQIQRYEGVIAQLNSYDAVIVNNDQQAEDLRKKIIYTDLINKGFSEARAQRETEKSVTSGNDVDDAKEALQSLKDYYKDEYEDLLKEAEEKEKKFRADREKQGQDLKKAILEDKGLFEQFELNNVMRQKVYDNVSKPIFKDENGKYLTALQKYQKENYNDYLAKTALFYTLTDGFKDLGKVLNAKLKSEVNKNLKNIEKALNNTARTSNGNLNYTSGVTDDSQSSLRVLF